MIRCFIFPTFLHFAFQNSELLECYTNASVLPLFRLLRSFIDQNKDLKVPVVPGDTLKRVKGPIRREPRGHPQRTGGYKSGRNWL